MLTSNLFKTIYKTTVITTDRSCEILEKIPFVIETLRFHLYYIYDIYYISANTFRYNAMLKQFWDAGWSLGSEKSIFTLQQQREILNLCNNSIDFV